MNPKLDPAIKDKLAEASSLADQLDERVGEIALDLRPYMLDDLGLVSALRWYGNRYAQRLGIEVEVEAMGLEERLPPQVETALYRVVQEALTNVARHAQASRVHLHLERTASAVAASIEDDGRGFEVEKTMGPEAARRGAGLIGMRERVISLGGTFHIQSRPGEGTRLTIEIPV
jgi:signal transduction histidine kinase